MYSHLCSADYLKVTKVFPYVFCRLLLRCHVLYYSYVMNIMDMYVFFLAGMYGMGEPPPTVQQNISTTGGPDHAVPMVTSCGDEAPSGLPKYAVGMCYSVTAA